MLPPGSEECLPFQRNLNKFGLKYSQCVSLSYKTHVKNIHSSSNNDMRPQDIKHPTCSICSSVWHVLMILMFSSSSGFLSNMSVHRQYFPDEEDEKGAAKALMRLQDTYKLDSESFSKGRLPGQEQLTGNSNSSSDLYFHTCLHFKSVSTGSCRDFFVICAAQSV